MRIIYRNIMILFLLVMTGSSFIFTAYGSDSSEQRVFDDAGLLTEDEIGELEEQAAVLRKEMKMDVVLVTIDDAGGKSSMEYADDYYDYGGFGNGQKASGVLFLIDMDNREIYISTTGVMIRYLTDERIESMLDNEIVYMQQGNYSGTMHQFLKDVEKYYHKGIPGGQYNIDIETGRVSKYRSIRWYEALLAVVISGFCAFSTCLGVAKSYAMKKERKQGTAALLAYRSDANFIMGTVSDRLVDKTLSQRRIETHTSVSGGGGGGRSSSGRSSTHRSSSGRSHGGGGRKF